MRDLTEAAKQIVFIFSSIALGAAALLFFTLACIHGYIILDEKLSTYHKRGVAIEMKREHK